MDDDEIILDLSECPPSNAVKLAQAEFGPAVVKFVGGLMLPHDVDGVLYEAILSGIAATLVEWTDIEFGDDGTFGAQPIFFI